MSAGAIAEGILLIMGGVSFGVVQSCDLAQ
jgi:hypothetical protein